MDKRVFFLSGSLLAAGLVAAALGACSSTTTVIETTDAASDAFPQSTRDSSTNDDAGLTGDQLCSVAATRTDCSNCCATNHTEGNTRFNTVVIACACKGTGSTAMDGGVDAGDAGDAGDGGNGIPPCATECASTTCATPQATASTACATCIQNSLTTGGPCVTYVSAQCGGDTDCRALLTCANSECKQTN